MPVNIETCPKPGPFQAPAISSSSATGGEGTTRFLNCLGLHILFRLCEANAITSSLNSPSQSTASIVQVDKMPAELLRFIHLISWKNHCVDFFHYAISILLPVEFSYVCTFRINALVSCLVKCGHRNLNSNYLHKRIPNNPTGVKKRE